MLEIAKLGALNIFVSMPKATCVVEIETEVEREL
jgi:hypothetical protein